MDRETIILVDLLYGEGGSKFRVSRLPDHIASIEMKIRPPERPSSTEQNLLITPAEVNDDGSYDESYEDAVSDNSSKTKNSGKSGTTASAISSVESKPKGLGQKRSDQKGKKTQGKCGNEKKNHFSRLLFSKCWSANQVRNAGCSPICCNKPGKVRKGACPAYSTCPCGDDAPCAKIEKKPCPKNK